MYFDFSPEQYIIRDAATEILNRRFPISRLRQLLHTETGFSPELWREIAAIGWNGMLVPEAYGGLGMTLLDLALVLEECGKALLIGPLVETAVMLPAALLAAGSPDQKDRWLSGIAAGSVVATAALAGGEGLVPPAGIAVQVRPDGAGGWILDGEVLLVPFADVSQVILTAACTGSGDAALFLLEPGDDGVSLAPMESLDPTMRLWTLKLNAVRLGADRAVGTPGQQGAEALKAAVQAGLAATALQAEGGAARCLDKTLSYLTERHQFGRPVGSFQAVKHRCADLFIELETARCMAWYAAWATSNGAPDADVAASEAKASCTEMYSQVAKDAIQLHGGNGFTWEYDIHFYCKRAKYLEFYLGSPSQHLDIVAESFLGTPS